MKVHIKTTSGPFDISIDDSIAKSQRVIDLKKKIEVQEGFAPYRQALYLKGIYLKDEEIVEELLQNEENFILALPRAKASDVNHFNSDNEVFLWTGQSRCKFEVKHVLPNREKTFDLKSGNFGVVVHIRGSKVEKYNLEAFVVDKGASIQLKNEGKDDLVKVFQIQDGVPPKKLTGITKTYAVPRNQQESSLDKAIKGSEIVANVECLIGTMADLIFGDEHGNTFKRQYNAVDSDLHTGNISQQPSNDEFVPKKAKTSVSEVLSNPNDLSCGYDTFWRYLLSLDRNISQYSTENVNLDSLSKKWKYILRSLLPKDAEEIIHSIQEVFGIEDIAHKMFTTFSILKNSLRSGELDISQFKDKLYPILEKVKNTSHEELLQVKAASSDTFNEYSTDEVILKHYSTLIKKLLPSHAIPIIGALDKLYETDEKKAIATEHILNRYCTMKYTSLEAIEEVKATILQYQSSSEFMNNFAFASTYKPVYDVIINKSLPQNLKDVEAFKDEVMTALNSIKTNGRLREWLIQVHDQRCFNYGWQKIDGSLTEEDFQSVSFEILDIFYGNVVHFSFKFLAFDMKYPNQNENFRSRLEKLNNLYRIALENIDDILPNTTSIKVENNLINIDIPSENKDDVQTILLDQFRDIWGKGVSSVSYRQELLRKLKLKFPHISYNTTEDILGLFENEEYRDMDGLKLQVRKTPSTNNVTLIDGYVLWPKETRRLSELPNEWFKKLYGIIVKIIPLNFHGSIGRTFIMNSSLYNEGDNCMSLTEEALSFLSQKGDILFKMLSHFRRNGGTVGDLRLALKECMNDDVNLPSEKNEQKFLYVQKLIENIGTLIDETYRKWKSSFETKFPGVITSRNTFEHFFKLYGLSQMAKMKVSEFNQKLENGEIHNGDQIWLWHCGYSTDSYAHVGIFVDEETVAASELVRDSHPPQKSIVHATARKSTTWQIMRWANDEAGKISCDPMMDVVNATDEVFVVRYGEGNEISGDEIARRALACCSPEITFYYDGDFGSSEIFASKVCGSTSIENLNLQGFRVACQRGKKEHIANHLHKEITLDDLIEKIDARMTIMRNI